MFIHLDSASSDLEFDLEHFLSVMETDAFAAFKK